MGGWVWERLAHPGAQVRRASRRSVGAAIPRSGPPSPARVQPYPAPDTPPPTHLVGVHAAARGGQRAHQAAAVVPAAGAGAGAQAGRRGQPAHVAPNLASACKNAWQEAWGVERCDGCAARAGSAAAVAAAGGEPGRRAGAAACAARRARRRAAAGGRREQQGLQRHAVVVRHKAAAEEAVVQEGGVAALEEEGGWAGGQVGHRQKQVDAREGEALRCGGRVAGLFGVFQPGEFSPWSGKGAGLAVPGAARPPAPSGSHGAQLLPHRGHLQQHAAVGVHAVLWARSRVGGRSRRRRQRCCSPEPALGSRQHRRRRRRRQAAAAAQQQHRRSADPRCPCRPARLPGCAGAGCEW